jgi:hypothetical protein
MGTVMTTGGRDMSFVEGPREGLRAYSEVRENDEHRRHPRRLDANA